MTLRKEKNVFRVFFLINFSLSWKILGIVVNEGIIQSYIEQIKIIKESDLKEEII